MIAQRVFAVAAAALFVVTVAVATFGSETMSLGQMLYLLDGDAADRFVSWSNHALGAWFMGSILQPMLVRPAWLVPAAGGIVCTGLSLSLSRSTHRSHRRS